MADNQKRGTTFVREFNFQLPSPYISLDDFAVTAKMRKKNALLESDKFSLDITKTPGTAKVQVKLTAEETEVLELGTYEYDFKFIFPDGSKDKSVTETIVLLDSIT